MRIAIQWMGRDGPSPGPAKVYSNVRDYEYAEDGRRLINFERYSVHLFTRNMAEVEIE